MSAPGAEGAFAEFARFTVSAAPAGPRLVIESIEVRKNVAEVKGQSEAGASVTVNGQRVDVHEDGSFSEFITLQAPGRQSLVVRAEGASGGIATVERSVVVAPF
jgi:hypothetical protein